MSTVSSPAALPKYIETLLSQRSGHVSAIASIDATLSRVTAALGGSPAPKAAPVKAVKAPAKKKAAKPAAKAPVAKAPVAKAPAAKAPAAKSSAAKPKDGLTAADFVLEFIKAKKTPTSQEVNKHWIASGRKGNADNSLSLLTKAKKLKRTPLGAGVRGSRYSVA